MSNKETLQSYNERLTTNNINLEEILDKVNKLPDSLIITNAGYLFYSGFRIEILNELLSLVSPTCENYYRTFSDSPDLKEIPMLRGDGANFIYNAFSNCPNLETFGGFINLGKGYLTNMSVNYARYTLDLSSSPKLTYDSLMKVINGVYDIKSLGCNTQQMVLGSENLAKLTADEIAIATNKGWTVS